MKALIAYEKWSEKPHKEIDIVWMTSLQLEVTIYDNPTSKKEDWDWSELDFFEVLSLDEFC